ncbi:hypothetical protein ACWC09_17115 [Streptomyces sp. NPDC001617]
MLLTTLEDASSRRRSSKSSGSPAPWACAGTFDEAMTMLDTAVRVAKQRKMGHQDLLAKAHTDLLPISPRIPVDAGPDWLAVLPLDLPTARIAQMALHRSAASRLLHSRYVRRLADTAVSGRPVAGAFQSPGDRVSPQVAAVRGVRAGPSRTHRSSG